MGFRMFEHISIDVHPSLYFIPVVYLVCYDIYSRARNDRESLFYTPLICDENYYSIYANSKHQNCISLKIKKFRRPFCNPPLNVSANVINCRHQCKATNLIL